MATIELKNLSKRFMQTTKPPGLWEFMNPFATVIRTIEKMQEQSPDSDPQRPFAMENLNLTIPDGKTMVILGPSGCGKSTLLRLIGGLMPPDAGNILYDDVDVTDVPPSERQIGMIFQNYALYPHFTSRGNVLSYFHFKKRTPELDQMAQEKYRKTSELLGVGIEYLMDKKPSHLSGGEKQRIALGRCITRDPKLFLLDEPFSNLDQKLREKYRVQLKKLLRHFQITTVYVTHDQQEALILADLLAVMNIGTIEQVGTPEEIYHQPYSMFVAEFLNFDSDTPAINFIDGATIAKELQGLVIGVRSEDIELCEENASEQSLTATISDIRHIPLKRATLVCAAIGNEEIYARMPFDESISLHDDMCVRFKKYHIFDKASGLRVQSSGAETA